MDLNDLLGEEAYNIDGEEREHSNSKYRRETYINRNLIFSAEYEKAICGLGESKRCSSQITASARKILEHHHGNDYEDLYFIDSVTGIIKCQDNYNLAPKRVELTPAMLKMLPGNPNIIAMHNHPDSMIPSLSDFYVCRERNYKYGLVICHNGTVYQYKDRQELNALSIETSIAGYMRREYTSLNNLYTSHDINMAHQEHIALLEKELFDAGVIFKEVIYNAR